MSSSVLMDALKDLVNRFLSLPKKTLDLEIVVIWIEIINTMVHSCILKMPCVFGMEPRNGYKGPSHVFVGFSKNNIFLYSKFVDLRLHRRSHI